MNSWYQALNNWKIWRKWVRQLRSWKYVLSSSNRTTWQNFNFVMFVLLLCKQLYSLRLKALFIIGSYSLASQKFSGKNNFLQSQYYPRVPNNCPTCLLIFEKFSTPPTGSTFIFAFTLPRLLVRWIHPAECLSTI